jgi:hypothetical protein
MPEDLATTDEIGLERLQRRPIVDRMDTRQFALIKATLAVSESDQHPITDAEVGHFLELCASYGLDPFAREAWIAKSKTGKLLIMVGRAGLRKVVNRNGLKMRSAVIYAKDDYSVEFIEGPEDAKPGEWEAHGCAPFHRVTHVQRGIGEARGVVVGAWARVTVQATGREAGWFDAPLSEYMPANVSAYSPWSKQVSAMVKGAVERQAAQESTTLGGLLVEGEDESADAAATVGHTVEGTVDIELPEAVEGVIARAKAIGDAELGSRDRVAMLIGGQPEADVAAWVAEQMAKLDALEPPEADVVDEGASDRVRRVESMFADADALLDEAKSLPEDDPDRESKIAEAGRIEAQARAIADGEQEALQL